MILIQVLPQIFQRYNWLGVNAQDCPIDSSQAGYSTSYTIQAANPGNWDTQINFTSNFQQAYCFSSITSNLYFLNNTEITNTTPFAIKRQSLTSSLLLINSATKNDQAGIQQLKVKVQNGTTTINYQVDLNLIKNCTSAILSSTGSTIQYKMDLNGGSNSLTQQAISFTTTDPGCAYTITPNFNGYSFITLTIDTKIVSNNPSSKDLFSLLFNIECLIKLYGVSDEYIYDF